jgi:uncharacterized membrane protein YdjX (TVP38/TMEM64 family)
VRRSSIALAAVVLVVMMTAWAVYSFVSSGLVYLLVQGSAGDEHWLEHVRAVVSGWGRLAPLLYTLAVVVEVIVAPIPGALLYAPAGAIFGGFLGGTLSLAGNVIGAAIACVLGSVIGERMVGKADTSRLARYQDLLRARGLWVVLLLRVNPLTSSDLVSYAAGIAGVPTWKVATGTLIGMAPLCYAQAYLSERLFELIPGRILAVTAIALVALLVVVLIVGTRPRGRGAAL